jgi:hypothetical protein
MDLPAKPKLPESAPALLALTIGLPVIFLALWLSAKKVPV